MDDAWEGFNGNEKNYDEKKEKSYQARIWWLIQIIGLGILVSLVVMQIKDFRRTQVYQCVQAEYVDSEKKLVSYRNEQGAELFYYMPSYSVKETKDGKVLLYYQNDSRYAEAIPTFASWVPYYLFFGLLTVLSGWRLWSIYVGKKHKIN